ncbi:hypothetical protein DSO57_1005039 [Entomophthora muscae]|uniref:Uncharacterized protein n=1 Tax=Entomophthora muscae TaxID=34485 RepID=A0ACC2UHE4_9FUNG|nr:hypothetical protein DSO57_1005039 [Entomophthora muscae]
MFFYLLLVLAGELLAEPATHILREGKFKVRLACASEDSICDGFKETIGHVSKFFGNAINLNKKVYVAIDIAPATVKAETGVMTLASTKVAYAWSKEVPDTIVPTALYKQLNTYSNDEKLFNNSCNANPAPAYKISPGYYGNTIGIKFFANSFERHIYTRKGEKLTSFVERLNNRNHIPRGDVTCKKPQLTDYHLDITNKIETLATTSEELYFKTLYRNNVILRTSGKYQHGKSISHLDMRYKETKETLMTEDGSLYYGVHDLEFDGWRTSPFGPLTLVVLATMGYQPNPNPLFENSLLGLKARIRENSSC